MKETTVSLARAVTASEAVLPVRMQEALGELVGAALEGLLALSVGVGLGVLAELLEEEVSEVVGPRSKPDPARVAYRHGHERGEVVLGGRVLPSERPRVRVKDGPAEFPLHTYQHVAESDPLARVVLARMLAGVSARRYPRTQEPVGEEVERRSRATSRSALSRRFKERTRQALEQLMSRRLDDLRLAVLILDGIELQGCSPACARSPRAGRCGRSQVWLVLNTDDVQGMLGPALIPARPLDILALLGS